MGYNNIPPLPDKFLMPDGSIVTFEGAEVAPPDEKRAQFYNTRQEQVAKWLLPDGSIVSGFPLNMSSFEEIFVPKTTKINNHPLSGDITLTAEDIGIEDPFEFKGTIDCSGNPNYPAADAGHLYIVSVAGKIGGASGIDVSPNDKLWCKVDSSLAGTQAEVGDNWNIIESAYNRVNQETNISKSASATLTAAECTNTIISIYDQSADMVLTLPPAFKGGGFAVIVAATAAYYLRITPSGSEVQSFDGTDLTAGYYVYTPTMTKGYMIQYIAIQTGASTYQWAALTVVGDWYAQT